MLRDQWEKETQALTGIRYRFEEYMATDDEKCKKRKQARPPVGLPIQRSMDYVTSFSALNRSL